MYPTANHWYDDALLVNRDSDWWTCFCLDGYTDKGYPMDFSTPETTRASLKDFVRRFAGHKITDVVMNVNAQCSSVPSEVMMWYGEKWKQTSENGIPVDYSDFPFKDWHRIFVEQNVDALQVMLDELEACGLRTWLSFRMNDCHP